VTGERAEPYRRRGPTTDTRVLAIRAGGATARERPDVLVSEEPLELRVGGPTGVATTLAVTMRTPGHDFELAVGFLVTEGIVRADDELQTVVYCGPAKGDQHFNVVTVRLLRPVDDAIVELRVRSLVTSASCGLCGAASLDAVERDCPPLSAGPLVDLPVLLGLPDALRESQAVFDRTGGLHGSALFEPDGTLVATREDVGRHNAVDKLVGHAYLQGGLAPLRGRVLVVSGRVSFEIVQKAAMAGIPIVAAVSAPSSLAVDAARRLGVTLAGFVRGGGANVYAHPERLTGLPGRPAAEVAIPANGRGADASP
jgi:FdhD protein